ncbi:MAG: class I SAM-dependent methyltransferase [Candidatus Pacebacteria bacterium]|nr:class I SAM-dependent methyltransferase [Candidatus Paceibacterota bacterium]
MDFTNFTNPEKNISELGLYEGMVVVDLGAGTGAYVVPLAKKVGETGRVYAIEVQKEFLANIKNLASHAGFKNVEVVWGDIERPNGTKLKDESADAVIVSNVLFQAEDKNGLLAEAKRILKQGGKLLLIEWKDSFNNLGPEPKAVVTSTEALNLCSAQGFILRKEFDAGEHHYGFVMVK